MKKNYLTKSDMARAIALKTGLTFNDVKSRLAKLKLKEYRTTTLVNGEEHEVSYFDTPEKYLN